jgi:DNA-binding MarR family transcriptional regulator
MSRPLLSIVAVSVGRRGSPGATGPRLSGAPGRIRTCNLLIRSQVLYPLSYGRIAPTAKSTGSPRRVWLAVAQMISSLVPVIGPAEDADEKLVASWDLVVRGVAATQERLLAKIEHDGVPAQWFEVLRLLLAADGHRMPMSALARDLTMTAGGFTKLADRMARDGLIDRRNSVGDRRVVYAALTPKGLRRARSSAELYHAALREHVAQVLSGQGLRDLTSAMSLLHAAHAEPEIPSGLDGPLVPKNRDPALPERRRRGRRPR